MRPASCVRALVVLATLSAGCVAEHEAADADDDEGVLEGKGDGAAIACPGDTRRDPKWAELERQVVMLTNQRRAAGATCGGTRYPAVPALRADRSLTCAARAHSSDMVARDFFNHINPDGDGPYERIPAAGYRGQAIGENIAAGHPTPAAVVDGWIASAGHCRNLMNAQYLAIGVGFDGGVITGGDGAITGAWTQAFGGG